MHLKKYFKISADNKITSINKLAKQAYQYGYELVITKTLYKRTGHYKILIAKKDSFAVEKAARQKKAPTLSIPILNIAWQKAHHWLTDILDYCSSLTEEQVYFILRAVLHAVRDSLKIDEAIFLGTQLPMLIRGFYYEGWDPSLTHPENQTRDYFLNNIRQILMSKHQTTQPEEAARIVFALLNQKQSEGEIGQVKNVLFPAILDLWP